jgi:hypothetical protein
MQLKKNQRQRLTLAVCTLLGSGAAPLAYATDTAGTSPVVDSGFLWYQEDNNRIRDAEVIVNIKQSTSEDRSWNAHLTFDTVCGGSPIGALPSKQAQSFFTPNATTLNPVPTPVQTTTSASGGGGGGLGNVSLCTNPVINQHYTVAAGAMPVDQSFHDQRVAISGGYETTLFSNQSHLALGGAASHETDFLSLSLNGSLAQDFNQRNTTLSAGLNVESDSINPVGGTPVAGSAYGLFNKIGNQTRQVQTVVLGGTQVVTRRWLTQFNVNAERSNGYQTDPYKIVSVLDANGNPAPIVTASGAQLDYVYERRPQDRNRWGLYWDNRVALDHDTVQVSYRHTQDSWGIKTDTVEAHYRLQLASWGYVEPHVRAYRQNAANFYQLFLVQGASLPGYFSADPRLAAFHAGTYGLKYGIPMDDTGGELSFRLERYQQRGSVNGTLPVGLQGLDLYPGLSATLFQVGARFSF